MNKPRPSFNVEDELAAAIEPIGGRRVTAVLGRVPGHKNADFVFPSASVVSELKCLDEDKIVDQRIIEKASNLYVEELQSGCAPVMVFGEVRMTTEGFSDGYKRKIADLYRVPIERLARDANQQIEQTAQALKMEHTAGLFLLANNNHTALDPQHAWHIVNQILGQDKYLSINTAVVFSGNLGAVLPDAPNRVDYWIEIQRPGMRAVDPQFMSSLRETWHARLAQILGEPAAIALPTYMSTFSKLESR
jgi:hypothetical protein